MKNFGVIYVKTNKLNGKRYVGQTTRDLSLRNREHEIQSQCFVMNSAILKYGAENFVTEVLAYAESREELDSLEQEWIQKLNTKSPNGYNVTDGGSGTSGYKHNEASRARMSTASKGKRTGEENSFFGKKHTEETKEKLRRPKTDEARAAMSAAKQRQLSEGWKPVCAEKSPEQYDRARLIWRFSTEGLSNIDIATKTAVSTSAVSLILRGLRFPSIYKEFKGEDPNPKIISHIEREDRARSIFEMRASGKKVRHIAKELGMSEGNVSGILHGRKHRSIYEEKTCKARS